MKQFEQELKAQKEQEGQLVQHMQDQIYQGEMLSIDHDEMILDLT
jgi:hypothetical protein